MSDNQTMHKEAVDSKTKEYWSAYFKEYGQMWVRDIPRRIKAEMTTKLAAKEIEGRVAPLANCTTKDGMLSIEAAFVGKIDGQDAKGTAVAQFAQNGDLKSFEFTRIS